MQIDAELIRDAVLAWGGARIPLGIAALDRMVAALADYEVAATARAKRIAELEAQVEALRPRTQLEIENARYGGKA